MSKYFPFVVQNKLRRAYDCHFRTLHQFRFSTLSIPLNSQVITILKKGIIENNCYCEAQRHSRRQEISAPTAHYSRSAETEFETTSWRLSRWIIPRLPRSVPMDEELKYKRYRENITNSIFSDAVFRTNLSTSAAACDIIEMEISEERLYPFFVEIVFIS